MQPSTQNCRSLTTNVAWFVLAGAIAMAAADCEAQVLADPQRAWQPDPQQRLALTINTHQVGQQPPTWQPRSGSAEAQPGQLTQTSLGLEFRRRSSTQSAKDLLKVQLTADSALNFRPRGGGMVVTYRSQF